MIPAKPLTYTPDDSPKFMQEGFEDVPDAKGIALMLGFIVLCFGGLAGVVAIARRLM